MDCLTKLVLLRSVMCFGTICDAKAANFGVLEPEMIAK
jgi:hypothetical protein